MLYSLKELLLQALPFMLITSFTDRICHLALGNVLKYFITMKLSRIEITVYYHLYSLPLYLGVCESQYVVHIPVNCFKDNIASYKSLMLSRVLSMSFELQY